MLRHQERLMPFINNFSHLFNVHFIPIFENAYIKINTLSFIKDLKIQQIFIKEKAVYKRHTEKRQLSQAIRN